VDKEKEAAATVQKMSTYFHYSSDNIQFAAVKQFSSVSNSSVQHEQRSKSTAVRSPEFRRNSRSHSQL